MYTHTHTHTHTHARTHACTHTHTFLEKALWRVMHWVFCGGTCCSKKEEKGCVHTLSRHDIAPYLISSRQQLVQGMDSLASPNHSWDHKCMLIDFLMPCLAQGYTYACPYFSTSFSPSPWVTASDMRPVSLQASDLWMGFFPYWTVSFSETILGAVPKFSHLLRGN